MLKSTFRSVLFIGLWLPSLSLSQELPLERPSLLPFPGLSLQLSYQSLVPGNALILHNSVSGWNSQDTLRNAAGGLDIELLRYRWGKRFLSNPRMDAYSSLRFSTYSQLGDQEFPGGIPSTYLVNNTLIQNVVFNTRVREVSLSHTFEYQLRKRHTLLGTLGTGLARLSVLKTGDGGRILRSTGVGLHTGLGWRYRLFGREGKRVYLGVDLGYSLRIFDLSSEHEGFSRADGSNPGVSPFESISLNTPDLQISLEMGELLYSAYTPFRDPFRLGLLTLGIGYGLNNYEDGVSIQYDSTDTRLSIPFAGKLNRSVDIQLLRYNWPFHLIKQANVDVSSGLGVRYWKTSARVTLPATWATELTDGDNIYEGLRFSPRVRDIYVNHEILYPLSPRWHFKVLAGTGFASMTLYENELLERVISSQSLSWQWGGGLGYTLRGDGSSKVAIGVGVHYHHQAFDLSESGTDLSPVTPGERVPIQYIDLSSVNVSLNIGIVFGGNANNAHKALETFRNKQFTRALEFQDELLSMYPDHHNKKLLETQREMIEDSLVTYYYRDVRTILDQGRLETALALITRGEQPPGDKVQEAVDVMRIEIANEALSRARFALQSLDHEIAEQNILIALKADPRVLDLSKILLSRSYIIRATILYQEGIYNRSLFWLKQADGMSDRYSIVTANLRRKIADGRLDDANEAILREDRQMVLESMLDARDLDPSLGDIVNPHLKDLQAAIAYLEDQEIGPMKRMALDNLLDDIEGLSPENFEPRVGMKASLIARYVGPPERRFMEENYELWVYPRSKTMEIWLYLRDGLVEKIEYQPKD